MRALSITAFCRQNDLNRDEIKEWLIANGFLLDLYHATEKGKNAGISSAVTRDGNRYLVYNEQAQAVILENCAKETEEPGLDYGAFPKLRLGNFVILDTETTGLGRDDEVVELGIIDSEGKILYQSLFLPQKQIHWAASKVNGLTNEDLADAPLFQDEWENIKRAVGNKIIVGHNISFDKKLITQTLQRYGLNTGEAARLFRNCRDSVTIAREHIYAENYRLETLCMKLGLADGQKHRACDDCLMVLRLLEAIERGNTGLEEPW